MNILVIKVAAIGDFLMATPALRALKRSAADARLHVLAGNSLAAVVAANPDVDRVHLIDDRRLFRGSLAAQAWEAARAGWRLRRERCGVGFNFHRDWRFAVILLLAGCRRRIGFARGRRRPWLLTDAVRVEGIKHHVFHYCDLLRPLGIFCLDFRMEFPLAAADLEAVRREFLVPRGLEDYVVLAPGGASNVKEEMASRRWPEENFAALAGLLAAAGRRVALLGGPGDADAAGRIAAAQPHVIDFTGRTSLAQAAALLRLSRLAVCNDSGLMHLAAAVGTRVISIFGPTHPGEKKPLNEGSVALWKGEGLDCAPCYHDGVFPACEHLSCMKKIAPQEAFQVIQQVLSPPRDLPS